MRLLMQFVMVPDSRGCRQLVNEICHTSKRLGLESRSKHHIARKRTAATNDFQIRTPVPLLTLCLPILFRFGPTPNIFMYNSKPIAPMPSRKRVEGSGTEVKEKWLNRFLRLETAYQSPPVKPM